MSVQLFDVSRRFSNQWALARVSLEIPTGRTVLLTGENGAGKTTLLKIISTATRPTVGRVELFGLNVTEDLARVRRRLALISHQLHLYGELSGRENVALAASMTGRASSCVAPLLERVGLTAHADRPLRGYSAGMKRRAALARMLLLEPELVLLDEPFGQLDPGGVELMKEIIRELQQRGCTLIIATHDIERGKALSNMHVHLSAGRVRTAEVAA